jgi:hypothetical protein
MDLPDYLPGNPPMYGVKQASTSFYQGDCIEIAIPITVDPRCTLVAYVKDDLASSTFLWVGKQGNGVDVNLGRVTVKIKSSVAQGFPSGIYYLTVAGQWPSDINAYQVLYNISFSINAAASSPYPVVQPTIVIVSSAPPPGVAYIPISYFG